MKTFTTLVPLLCLVFIALAFISSRMYRKLLEDRATAFERLEQKPINVLDDPDKIRAEFNRRTKALDADMEWMRSDECRKATNVPLYPLYLYIRDHLGGRKWTTRSTSNSGLVL